MTWQGNVLRVNLSTRTIQAEPLNTEWAEDYLGERGLGTKYLWENMNPKTDALAPENVLIFATGPLTGTMASTGGRYTVLCKSPLTGAIACSNSGGKFGAELRHAGYDLLIIEGMADELLYLCIEDDTPSLHSAAAIKGEGVWKTDTWIKAQHADPLMRVAAIGGAGESLCRYASIINDLHRAAGRSGVGAVMGSKNLKAIAIRGTKGVTVHDGTRFMATVRESHAAMKQNTGRQSLTEYGTNAMIDSMQSFGGLPTRNFQAVQFDGTTHINAEAQWRVHEDGFRHHVTNKACFGCTIACGRIARIREDHFTVINRPEYRHASGGLEYETAFALGPMVGVDDIDALTFAGYMSNEHGYDPISFGGTLAAAMELFEMGVLSKEDTDSVDLRFGNAEALCIMAEKTGRGEGFGAVLALGSKGLAEKYAHPEIAMQVKGQEFAGYDSRALQGMGLGYATSNRGACHLKHAVFAEDMAEQTGSGKAAPCKTSQDKVAAIDSTGLCLFVADAGMTMQHFCDLLNAALPPDSKGAWSEARLMETGERVWNLERLFNLDAGLSAADDTLPERLLKEPAPSGTAAGKVSDLPVMLPEYYALRQWGKDGVPTAALRTRLGL